MQPCVQPQQTPSPGRSRGAPYVRCPPPLQLLFYGLTRQKKQEADDRLPVYLAPTPQRDW